MYISIFSRLSKYGWIDYEPAEAYQIKEDKEIWSDQETGRILMTEANGNVFKLYIPGQDEAGNWTKVRDGTRFIGYQSYQ